jgi:DNA-binding GntR family transcriptional regulator
MSLNLGPVESLSLKERVYTKLLHAIVSGRLLPGTQVTTAQLAEEFHVSLMPVREALRKLEAGNLISIQKNRRIVVKELSADDMNELLQIRLNLELMATRKAMRNCTDELIGELERLMEEIKNSENSVDFLEKNKLFHHTLYREANMPILQAIIEDLWLRVSPYFHIFVSETPNYKNLKIHYHEGILQGVKKRDSKMVCRWLALDLKKAAKLVTGLLTSEDKLSPDD